MLQLGNAIPVNVIMFIPAMLLGLIGGLLGAVFTVVNLKMSRIRRRLLAKVRKPIAQKVLRFLEPPLIMVRQLKILLSCKIIQFGIRKVTILQLGLEPL